MTTETRTFAQHAIFAEKWEVGGHILERLAPVDIDGPASEAESPRGDREWWERRVKELETRGPRIGADGKRVIFQNVQLRERKVTITVTDWALTEH